MGNPTLSFYVLGLALLFEGAHGFFAFQAFTHSKGKWSYIEAVKRGKDPSMFVVLFEDSAAMLGLVVAFIGIGISHLTGNPVYDGMDLHIKQSCPTVKRAFIEAEAWSALTARHQHH
jgi:hypothetical protein